MKCRFSHVLPDSEEPPQDKRQRQHSESNGGYMKNDASCIGGSRAEQKDSTLKDIHSGGPPMQLKVSSLTFFLFLMCYKHIDPKGYMNSYQCN